MTHEGRGHGIGDWCWHARHAAPCRVVDREEIWGKIAYRVWLPGKDAVVRARTSDLSSLDSVQPTSDEILHTAAAAKLLTPAWPVFFAVCTARTWWLSAPPATRSTSNSTTQSISGSTTQFPPHSATAAETRRVTVPPATDPPPRRPRPLQIGLLEIEQFKNLIGAFVQDCFSAEKAHHTAIDAITTLEAAEAYDVNAGWPS